jgi:hypothetical protein
MVMDREVTTRMLVVTLTRTSSVDRKEHTREQHATVTRVN